MNNIPQDPLKLMSLIGALCSDLGLHDQALAIFDSLVVLRDEDPNALTSLAMAQSRAGQDRAALATYRRVLQIDSRHDMARVLLAVQLHKSGDTAAQTHLRAVLADGLDADALALASSVQEEILRASPPVAADAVTERVSRHKYTRLSAG